MKNWGQIERKVKIKKSYTLSEHVLNLTEEAKQWAELSKRLRKRVRGFGI